MATTYTTNKNIAYPQIGDAGTGWATAQITGVQDIDVALGTTQSMNLQSVSGNVTLVSAYVGAYPANSASYVPLAISTSGAPSAAVTILIPYGVGGQWVVTNACTGTYSSVTFGLVGGTGTVTLATGQTRSIYSNGVGVFYSDTQTASAGSTTQVIYNNSGSLAGSANLTFDGTTLTANAESITGALTVGTTVTAGGIVKSTSGGFTFPDNTNQVTAATTGGIIPSAFSGLKITAATATITVTANYVSLFNGTNFYTAASPILSILTTNTPGNPNALDTGTISSNTWYSVWVIYNPTTTTVAGLISLSATAPTLPSGYTYKARVGWVRYGTGALVGTVQYGNRTQYTASNLMASGSGTSYWTAIPVGSFVPSTSAELKGTLYNTNGATNSGVAPNNSWGTSNGGSSTPPIYLNNGNTATFAFAAQFQFTLESTNIYWGGSGGVICHGWTDNL